MADHGLLRCALMLVFVAILAPTCAARAATRQFEFLYIEASEGTASGGHAAIKFDDEVFHFQHVEPGLLRAYRNDFSAFRFAYGDQDNRAIHGHRIEVDDTVFQALRDAFKRKLLIQNRQFSDFKALEDDLRLLNEMKTQGEGRMPRLIQLKGLGYFFEHYRYRQEAGASQSASELLALKQAMAAEFGEGFLQQKRDEVMARLQALRPSDVPLALDENRLETGAYSFARRYRDLLLDLAALDVIERGRAPRPETLLTADLSSLKLSENAVAKLTAFRRAQFADLVKLMGSERRDWGYPLLVGMARLCALDRSIRTGRLVVLDRFSPADDDDKTLTVDAGNRAAALEFAEKILAHASRRLEQTEALDESGYGQIEVGVGTWLRVEAAAQTRQALVLPALDGTPSLVADADLIPLVMDFGELDYYRRSVDARLQAYRAGLQNLYRYRLLNRNCVTEIFRVINDSLGRHFVSLRSDGDGKEEAIREASDRWLGGHIDNQGWHDIPFVAFSEVGSRYRVRSSYRLPPYRERQVNRRYESDAGFLVDLAESNTLTSSVYRWHGDDAAFLFFTQDAVWPRPLLGGANLAVALGQSLYGLMTWPWDQGRNLQKSLKGIAVSVPELFFFNIRKGSFPRLLPSISSSSDNG